MSPPIANLSAFFSELQRRRVFRVAVVYAGVAFIVFQIVDATFDYLPIPDWVGTTIIVLLLVGFPIAVGLAWAFDITDKGVVRTAAQDTAAPQCTPRPIFGNLTLGIVAALAIAVAVWSWWGRPSSAEAITSIAVLPLDNLMNDPDQDYFVDGMHEALVSELGKISALRVISRTSAVCYRETDKSLPEIARELGVDAVVEGSVLRIGDRVKITAQLMGTAPERHLWTDDYTRDLVDILELHSEVARAIAKEIKVTMTPGERARLTESRKISPEAHDHYLKGLHHWNKRTEEGFHRALEHFQASIDADPSYAPAYAGLALTYELLGEYVFMPASASYPQAITYAEQALRLDPNLAEAHTALAAARLYYHYDWKGAEAGYKKAIALNPGYATAYQWQSELSNFLGRHEDALVYIDKSLSIDPLSKVMYMVRGETLVYLGRYDEAIVQFDEREKLYPGIGPNTLWHVWALIQAGHLDEAVDLDLKILRHYVDSTGIESARLQASYAQGGFDSYAREWVSVMDKWDYNAVWVWSVAWRHALTGNVENTLAALERDLREKNWTLLLLNINPDFDFLRDEPRFQAILREIGLEP